MVIRMARLGRKRGMGQIFREDGTRVPVTAIEVTPNVVLRVKSESGRDGYNAIQVGFEDKPARLVNKPDSGQFAKAETTPKRVVREFRIEADSVEDYKVGQDLGLEIFDAGMRVDVTGVSKGRGFAGVMKRHGFKGAKTNTHGTHEYFRHAGSIGCSAYPGRVWKGHNMAGQLGNDTTTIQGLEVVRVLRDENLILVKGGVPGARNGLITIRHSVKALEPELPELEQDAADDGATEEAEA